MNIHNMNQSHGIHRIHTQINPFHHFVQGVVRGFPPFNHDRALTHGTVGDLTLEAVNNERDALVQQVVQVRGDPRHLRHHPNLSKKKKSQSQGHEKKNMCIQDNTLTEKR